MATAKNGSKLAVLFPGQGSQFLGMAREFLEGSAEAQSLMKTAEAACRYPLRRLCMEGPMEELTRAAHLQPALTVTNLICWQALERAGVRPDFVAGHSLGEFSALVAAGVLSPGEALTLVTERGRLMEREGDQRPGGMRAVLGLTVEEVEDVLAGISGAGVVTVANHNTEKQVVISGENEALNTAEEVFSDGGARVIALNVSIANHSPLVEGAIVDFAKAMARVSFRSPTVPLYFNVTAAPETDPAKIRDIMARQIAARVRWLEIINAFLAAGVETFIEVGPKKVLSGLLKKIVPRGRHYASFQIDTPEALEQCLRDL